MDNQYIDPETGKFKDSKRSEFIGAIGGGIAGSLGINAMNALNGYKQELADVEEYKRTLPNIDNDINDLEFASIDLERLHALRQDPNALQNLPPNEQAYYQKLSDATERIAERGKWENFHEHPLQDRLQMLIRGKPSLEGVDPAVIDNAQSMFGDRPYDPKVANELSSQLDDLHYTRKLVEDAAQRVPQFQARNLLPSLEHYHPKRLIQTARNPLIMGGMMLGAGAGTVYDEYRKHLEAARLRNGEDDLTKQAAFGIPKFETPKIKKPKPLIPKKVKRIGMLTGGIGVLGYTGYNATKDFAAGTELAPAASDEGMTKKMANNEDKYLALQKEAFSLGGLGSKVDGAFKSMGTSVKNRASNFKNTFNGQKVKDAKSALRFGESLNAPKEATDLLKKNVRKEKLKRAGMVGGLAASGAGVATYGGVQVAKKLESPEKTAAEKYAELSKIAFDGGSDDYWQAYADQSNRGVGQRIVDGAHEAGVNVAEGIRNVDPALLKRLGIGAGALAGAGAATYGGVQLANHLQQQKTASDKYIELSKIAFDGGSDDYWQAYADQSNRGVGQRIVDGAHEAGVNVAEGIRNVDPALLKRLGIGAGALAGAGAATYGGVQLANHLQQEKTAAENDKQPSVGKSVAIGTAAGLGAGAIGGGVMGHLATNEKALDKTRLKLIDNLQGEAPGVMSDAVLHFDEMADVMSKNKKLIRGMSTGILGAKGALIGGGIGLAGGLAAKSKFNKNQGTEKIAKEMKREKSEYALEHPFKKSVKDGAKWGAIAGAPFFGVGAIPGAALGAATGLQYGASRAVAGDAAASGEDARFSPTAAGALTGAGVAGALMAPSFVRSLQTNPIGGTAALVGNVATAGGIGALVGRNQEKHFNNAQGNGFKSSNELKMNEKLRKHDDQLDDSTEKAASEAINELFKEASTAIDAPMEKVAGYEDPMSRITFGYDKL